MKTMQQTLNRKRPAKPVRAKESSSSRLEARIPLSLKKMLSHAAELTGHVSVSSYIIQTLRENASRTVEQSRRAELNAAESAAFVRSLLEPARPAAALAAAFARYREQVR